MQRLLLPGLLALLAGGLLLPTAAQAASETSPCTPGLQAKGYKVRDVDNHGWYDQIDVTTKDGRRLELDVRRPDCTIMRERPD